HHGAVRGQAGRHARSGCVLAGDLAAPGERILHGAHGDPRDQARRSHRGARAALRSRRIPHLLPRRRAVRPRHAALGGAAARRAGHRPLVADGDRMVDRGELHGAGDAAVKPGSCAKPVAGYDVRVLDEDGKEVAAGVTGNIVIRLPLPPGCLPTLWKNDDGYVRSYLSRYPGYYLTADAGYKDAD